MAHPSILWITHTLASPPAPPPLDRPRRHPGQCQLFRPAGPLPGPPEVRAAGLSPKAPLRGRRKHPLKGSAGAGISQRGSAPQAGMRPGQIAT